MTVMDRREWLHISAVAFGGTIVGFSPVAAESTNGKYDVSYLWTPHREDALDYMEEVGEILGPAVRKELRIVRAEKTGAYGIVYSRNTTRASAARTAQSHSRLLTDADLDPASIVEDRDYYELYNVVYGTGPSLNVHRANFTRVAAQLGPELAKDLVIEERGHGTYALVYRRRGEKESTYEVAQDHTRLLRPLGISADISLERNHDVIYTSATELDNIVQVEDTGTLHIERTKEKPNVKIDSNLEQQINDYIQGLRRQGKLDSSDCERTAWSVYDLTTDEKLVSINEDLPFQAASMIKPFVALAFFHQVSKGRLSYGPTSQRMIERMIQRSNNGSTNWVMETVGGPRRVERILYQDYGSIFEQVRIVEYIPDNGRSYANMASAHDYSRFLYALWHDQLPSSQEIKRLMSLPNGDRIHRDTRIPGGTLVYDKTGTTARCCGDFGILAARGRNGRRYPYTIVGIIDRTTRATNYTSFKQTRGNIIREVSNRVYGEMKRRHELV